METNNPEQRLDFLIELFDQGTISYAQQQELLLLLADPELEEKAKTFMDRTWGKTTPISQFFDPSVTSRIHTNLMEHADAQKPKSSLLHHRWFRITAAAAVLVVILLSVIYSQLNSGLKPIDQATTSTYITDVAPGGNKATLQLANKQVIALDQVKNGVVVSLGGLTVKKTKDGQLVFEVNQTAQFNSEKEEFNTITTPAGGQYEVVLADGTQVWLNASTSLKFPTRFIQHERRVELVGEGYFEVSKLKGMPFIVNAKDMKVEVLGTHFNINAYPDEQTTTTTLVEGSVKVTNNKHMAILKPEDQAQFKNGSLQVTKVDVKDALAWKLGYFSFHHEDIRSVMRKLARWYNVKIEYEDPAVNEEFEGTISKYKNISEILKTLQATGTINFKILPSEDPQYERRIVVMK